MKFLVLIEMLIIVSELYAQQPKQTISISGIVVSVDSIAIPDVAIVNSRTGKTIRTNAAGYFKTEIAGDDSLFVYHISYERRYITRKNNGKLIFMKPEIQQLKQVDVNDISKQQQKNLDATMEDILRLAPMKTLTGYELHSREDYFILENGSQTRGFSPFFGPTVNIPLGKITGLLPMQKKQKDNVKSKSQTKSKKKNTKEATKIKNQVTPDE